MPDEVLVHESWGTLVTDTENRLLFRLSSDQSEIYEVTKPWRNRLLHVYEDSQTAWLRGELTYLDYKAKVKLELIAYVKAKLSPEKIIDMLNMAEQHGKWLGQEELLKQIKRMLRID